MQTSNNYETLCSTQPEEEEEKAASKYSQRESNRKVKRSKEGRQQPSSKQVQAGNCAGAAAISVGKECEVLCHLVQISLSMMYICLHACDMMCAGNNKCYCYAMSES
ncbi:unnamed protein product [Ceratitis capitata]|uniref:(Mediterranean fruit fly) hypothetical protein n=1 Tax=Ceratitis capitata TaxID=7213 RepID=A0A811VB96_CERCA|nr:unnamed protein product [Ceratitis capitata]